MSLEKERTRKGIYQLSRVIEILRQCRREEFTIAAHCEPGIRNNFCRGHQTLRVTPAMAAGVTDRLWDVSDLVALWESYEREGESAA